MSEDPKSVFMSTKAKRIWPSENYYLNMWKEGSTWKDGDFTPCQINSSNELMTFDASYGLIYDIENALGIRVEPSEAEEKRFAQEEDKYWEPIHRDLKQGITSGTVDGVAGRRHWRIIYDPSKDYNRRNHNIPFETWANKVVPVEPGQEYGTRITPKTDRSQWIAFGGDVDPMAEALAQAILDGEDPKRVFRQMQGPEPLYTVSITVFDRAKLKPVYMGKFTINTDSDEVTDEHYSPKLQQKPSPQDFQDIAASLRRWGHHMGGHYPKDDPYPGRFHWHAKPAVSIENHLPMLNVSGPNWTVRGPLLKDREGWYMWRFESLTPEQHHVLKQFGEFIAGAMNEGREFRGTLDNEETWDSMFGDETPGYEPTGPVTITWHVSGVPELAPTTSGEMPDWSGLAPALP